MHPGASTRHGWPPTRHAHRDPYLLGLCIAFKMAFPLLHDERERTELLAATGTGEAVAPRPAPPALPNASCVRLSMAAILGR